jgi:hypothetical protein
MRVNFMTRLEVIKGHGDRWQLAAPFTVYLDDDVLARAGVPGALGLTLNVPVGFDMDFASVPRVPLAYWLVGNTAHQSAVVHDYLYAVRAPRELADKVFLAAMEAEGIPSWRRALMYSAVRAFGGSYYGERETEEQETPLPPA